MKPKFAFCGYPLRARWSAGSVATGEIWRPCGNIATPGCAYCDEHANCTVDDLPRILTADEIVERADRAATRRKNNAWLLAMAAVTVFVALTEPVHAWIGVHLQFFFGVFAGSVATGTWWGIWRWRKGDRP